MFHWEGLLAYVVVPIGDSRLSTQPAPFTDTKLAASIGRVGVAPFFAIPVASGASQLRMFEHSGIVPR